MEHPKDREFRKAYEKAVASGDAQGSMANWMNDNAKNGLVKKLDVYCEHISARMEAEEKKSLIHTEKLLEQSQRLMMILQNIKVCQSDF